MPILRTVIDHKARPQGSKNPYRNKHTGRIILVESNKGLKQSRRELSTWLILEATRQGWDIPDKDTPIHIDLVFTFTKPKTAKRIHHTTKPDADKLIRYTLDAVSDSLRIWLDDCQVASGSWLKQYGDTDQIELAIRY